MLRQLLELLLLGRRRPRGEPAPFSAEASEPLGSSMVPRLSREEPDEEVVEVRLTGRSWLPSWWSEAETGILALLPGGGAPGRFWAGQTKGKPLESLQKQKAKGWLPGAEGGGNGELLFKGYRVSVLQDNESSTDGWRRWMHNNGNVLNTSEHLKMRILCYVYFTTIIKATALNLKEVPAFRLYEHLQGYPSHIPA